MQSNLDALQKTALDSLKAIQTLSELPNWHHQYLGKKGEVTALLKTLGSLPPEERRSAGQLINHVKQALQETFDAHQSQLEEAALQAKLAADTIDVSLPGKPRPQGSLHISTQTMRKVCGIFEEMGFQTYHAPEVETDEYNFQLLNMPEYHPARDMWDTFWVNDECVLRTHTSPGQIRAMREYHPQPIRVILPGKVYRYEQITPRSEHQFFQIEGLAVGKKIRMTDLIGTITQFAKKMYGKDRKVRIRGSYFPFTEPSIEIDMDCILCNGKGCRVCKHTNWLEIGGAGMVHPVVLKNGGYDPDEWSGFAFGLGVERPAMLKHDIHDIRYFYGNDIDFLKQF